MQIESIPLSLQLRNPFKLSYGTTTTRGNVLVRISDGPPTGVGEAAVVPYYHESPQRIVDYVSSPAIRDALPTDIRCLHDAISKLPVGESSAARAAVDMALHDLWGKHLGYPLYRLWGLDPARTPLSSFTVAMTDDDASFRERIRAAHDHPLIKLKLGGTDWHTDLDRVRIAREETSAQLCVDANGGWSTAEALEIIPQLAELGLLFIEQPVAKDNYAGWSELMTSLPATRPPLIADESVQGVDSVIQLAGLVDGINIKLAKCGGLQAARQMIQLARAYGIRIMIGCMVESSVAVTAAAHLAPLADFVDLDGNLLITNDPYTGVKTQTGRLTLPDMPGVGVAPTPAVMGD